jgi:penicillin amidase
MSFSEDDGADDSPRQRLRVRPESAPSHDDASPHDEPRLLTRRGPVTLTRPRRRTLLRRLFAAIVVLAIAAAIALVVASLWLRHSMRAALPQLDGTLHVAGLTAPVTVTRNAQGVPSIRAANLDDLLFAQGFVTAQDRLWQMDVLRRHAAGELAEILGPPLIDHDKRQRYLQLRAAADAAAQNLSVDQLHELQAYARGVNAFIDTHRDRLPVEFHLLHYAPCPWIPRDSLLVALVMWQDLSTSFPQKLDRETLARHLPPALVADLYPVGSWRDRPPTEPQPDLTTPHEIEQIPLDRTQSRLAPPSSPASVTPDDLLAVSAALSPSHCEDCRPGSNNWAISGARSASGAPLVSNDMHLGLSVPDIWYEAALHLAATPAGNATSENNQPIDTPGNQPIDVVGFTLPGLPWVLVGRNAHLAWSFTNLGADVQDLRVEHLRGSGASTQYQQPDGSWSPVEHHTEHIIVRAGPDVSLDVETVSHLVGETPTASPILSPLYPSEHRALSLAWTLYDPTNIDFSFLAVDSAADSASLVAAFAPFGGPSLNLIYADDHGHIGYHALGRIPIRGPAVHHPRAVPQFVMPAPEPDSDEDDEDNQSQLSPQTPPLNSPPLNAQLQQPPPHASVQPTVFIPSAPSAPHRSLITYTRARQRARRRSHPQPKIAPTPPVPSATDQSLPVAPAEQDYTIGSPISPLPVDARDPNQAWSGYIPYNELPSIQDPPSGVLATANARIVPDDYPYAIALDWVDPYRVERIDHLLEDHSGLTPQSMLALQNDQHSEFDLMLAQRIAYAIDHASAAARGRDASRLHQAADLLRNWQGNVSAGSPAAAIVSATYTELWPSLLVPQIVAHGHVSRADAQRLAHLYVWDERATALEDILQHNPAYWLPPGTSNWNDLLTLATARGLRHAHAPADLARWQYGSTHTIEIGHPLFASRRWLQWLLGAATGTGAQPAGGDTTTIDAIGHSFGPSERFTADLANPASTLSNLTTGESGNPASPWYLDQFLPWLRGVSFTLPLSESHAEHSLTLVP